MLDEVFTKNGENHEPAPLAGRTGNGPGRGKKENGGTKPEPPFSDIPIKGKTGGPDLGTPVSNIPTLAEMGVEKNRDTVAEPDRAEEADAAAARARHMRRALEDAIVHGIALLDALDAAGVDLEDDGTAEPCLGWIDGKPILSDSHDGPGRRAELSERRCGPGLRAA